MAHGHRDILHDLVGALFAVLPFGVRSQHETAEIVPGSDPGAPVAPRLLAKGLWTTAISLVAFAALMWLISVMT